MTRILRRRKCNGTFVCHCCGYCMSLEPDVLTLRREARSDAARRRRRAGPRTSARGRREEGSLRGERISGSSRLCRIKDKKSGTDAPVGTSAPDLLPPATRTGCRSSEPRRAEPLQVQVHGSRRVFGPLFLETRGSFLALPGHGEACHDGCDGYETDTQGADKRLPRGGWERRVGRGAACTSGILRARPVLERVTSESL